MRKYTRSALLGSASALAMGLAMSQAQAFDTVDWDWNSVIDEYVNINVDVNVEVDPAGADQVEKLQISLGDKSATARLDSFENIPVQTYERGLTQTTITQEDGQFHGGFAFGGKIKDEEIAYIKDYGYYEDPHYQPDTDYFSGGGHFGGSWSNTIEVTTDIPDPVNALRDLPQVSVSALALGNSESITSDVATAVHEGQFTFGDPTGEGGGVNGTIEVPVELAVNGQAEGYVDIEWTPETGMDPNAETGFVGIAGQPAGTSITEGANDPEGPDVVAGINGGEDPFVVTGTATGTVAVPVLGTSDWLSADNQHTALADTALSLALQGLITPASMSADASAGSIVNAQADVNATSIANNHSIELNAGTPDDAVLVADLVQFAYADNSASAYLGSQTVSNYINLGKLENALSNVSAVAAGNISNITVSGFKVDTPDVPGGDTGTD